MHPVYSPALMAFPTSFSPFSGAASSLGSRALSTSSEPEPWTRHSGVLSSPQSPLYGNSPSSPLIYQQGSRAFPPYHDPFTMDTQMSSRPLKQSLADHDCSTQCNGMPVSSDTYGPFPQSPGSFAFSAVGQSPRPTSLYSDWGRPRIGSGSMRPEYGFMDSTENAEFLVESSNRRAVERSKSATRYRSQRRPSNRDEFDGPHQLLDLPSPHTMTSQSRELPHLPTNLDVSEQDRILNGVNDRLSQCAFDFVAKYQFPIPVEPDKRQVRVPSDREWTEWVYLLKRLATKRRIPARVLYNGQIKQLVTVLENSLEMRHAAKHQSRPIKDDRNVLQLISAGTQVAKILKDASAMEYLDRLYVDTEKRISERRTRRVKFATP